MADGSTNRTRIVVIVRRITDDGHTRSRRWEGTAPTEDAADAILSTLGDQCHRHGLYRASADTR